MTFPSSGLDVPKHASAGSRPVLSPPRRSAPVPIHPILPEDRVQIYSDPHKLAESAIENENVELIQKLHQDGYDFNAPNRVVGELSTHLINAVYDNKPKAIRALIKAGADVNQTPQSGNNTAVRAAIYNAEKEGNFESLQAVLEACPILDEGQPERLQNLLKAEECELEPLLAKTLLKAVKDDNQPLITYLLDTVKLDPHVRVGNNNAATVAAHNSQWHTVAKFEKLGVINHFTHRVFKFANEMIKAGDNQQSRATALARLLSGDSAPAFKAVDSSAPAKEDVGSEPKASNNPSPTEDDELPFDFEE